VKDVDVALTGIYQKRRRMTLTYPIINRARLVLWLVTGNEKAGMLSRLIAGDSSIPAGRVRAVNSLVLADSAAAEQVDRGSKTEVA
jgi:6-phosphogluconolactonase/glucosamine-6-phosphate isomerase/deaminase